MSRAVSLVIMLLVAPAFGDDPPPPNPKEPVDYVAWVNAQYGKGIKENAADVYRKAFEAFVEDKTALEYAKRWDEPWKDYEKRKVERWLEQNRECLELFCKAAQVRGCYFELESESGAMIDVLLPDSRPVRDISRMFRARGRLRAEEGKVERAAEDVATLLQVGRHMESQPFLISYLVGLAGRAAGYELLIRLPGHAGERADYQAVLRAIRRVDRKPVSSSEQLDCERVYFLDTLQRACLDTDGDGKPDRLKIPGADDTLLVLDRPLDTIIQRHAGFMSQWEALARGDYATGLDRHGPLREEMKTDGHPVIYVLTPDFWRTVQLHHRTIAWRSAARIVLRIHAYKAEHGDWPEDLKAAKVASNMRKDPFSGQEFVYRIKHGEPVLYSVSENGKDDGGQPAARGKQWSDTGDAILWPPAAK